MSIGHEPSAATPFQCVVCKNYEIPLAYSTLMERNYCDEYYLNDFVNIFFFKYILGYCRITTGEGEVELFSYVKQEAHGSHRSPAKQFQSRNTFVNDKFG